MNEEVYEAKVKDSESIRQNAIRLASKSDAENLEAAHALLVSCKESNKRCLVLYESDSLAAGEDGQLRRSKESDDPPGFWMYFNPFSKNSKREFATFETQESLMDVSLFLQAVNGALLRQFGEMQYTYLKTFAEIYEAEAATKEEPEEGDKGNEDLESFLGKYKK